MSLTFFVTLHSELNDMKNILLSIGLFLFCVNIIAKPINVEMVNDSILVDSLMVDSIKEPSQEAVFLLESETYHFGTIDTLRQALEYDFNFCNDGLDTLVISRILTTPGVEIAEWDSINRYGFDEGGTIRFIIDPNEIKGSFKKSIYVYSNTPTRRLTLSGTVLRPRY